MLPGTEALAKLEQEMAGTQRASEAVAIREALAILVRPGRGWLSTGQASKRLGVTVPTVKDWIRRGTLEGQLVGSKWQVSVVSVDKVLDLRRILTEMEEEGNPTEEEIQELTRRVRREMLAEQTRRVKGW